MATRAGRMSEECRLELWALSIWPSMICAQLHGSWMRTIETRSAPVGAQGGGSNAGMASGGPM